jgi:hypothetical protein
MSVVQRMLWRGDRLYLGTRYSGYSVVPDQRYPTMWRVRSPDGSLSDMVNRTRAKDAARLYLERDQSQRRCGGGYVRLNSSTVGGGG